MQSAWGIDHGISKAVDPQTTQRGVRRGFRAANLGALGSVGGTFAALGSRGTTSKVGTGAVAGGALGAATGASLPIKKARDRVEGAKHGAEIGGYTGTALGTAAVLGHGLRKLKSQTPAQRTALKAALRHSAPKSKVGA